MSFIEFFFWAGEFESEDITETKKKMEVHHRGKTTLSIAIRTDPDIGCSYTVTFKRDDARSRSRRCVYAWQSRIWNQIAISPASAPHSIKVSFGPRGGDCCSIAIEKSHPDRRPSESNGQAIFLPCHTNKTEERTLDPDEFGTAFGPNKVVSLILVGSAATITQNTQAPNWPDTIV